MNPCRRCGARLFEGATFCTRCHAPGQASGEEVADLLREVDAAGGAMASATHAVRAMEARRASYCAPAPDYPVAHT